MLETFNQSVVATTVFYSVVGWGSSIGGGDAERLNKLRKGGSVLGCKLDLLVVLVVVVVLVRWRMNKPVDYSSFTRERYRKLFLLTAIRLYNESTLRMGGTVA